MVMNETFMIKRQSDRNEVPNEETDSEWSQNQIVLLSNVMTVTLLTMMAAVTIEQLS